MKSLRLLAFLIVLCLLAQPSIAVSASSVLRMAADIAPGPQSSRPHCLVAYNSMLYMYADNGSGNAIGTFDGSSFHKEVAVGNYASCFVIWNGKVYFSDDDGLHGYELWQYDPATREASMVVDVMPGSESSWPWALTVYNGNLYFMARDSIKGNHILKYDGRTVHKIAGQITPGGSELFVYKGKLYFAGTKHVEILDKRDWELWAYDGKSAGLAAQIGNPDSSSYFRGQPLDFHIYNNELYFAAYGPGSGVLQLWKFDGTEASLAAKVNLGRFSNVLGGDMIVFNHALYLVDRNEWAPWIWKYDGVSAKKLPWPCPWGVMPRVGTLNPDNLVVYKGALYFSAKDCLNRTEPEFWMLDSHDQLTLVARIAPANPTVYGNRLYFEWGDMAHGQELWFYETQPDVSLSCSPADGWAPVP